MTTASVRRYTVEDDATIFYLLRAKKTAAEIGEVIGRTKNSVIGRIRDVPELREVGFQHNQTKPRRTEPAGKRRYVRGGKPNLTRMKPANARPIAEIAKRVCYQEPRVDAVRDSGAVHEVGRGEGSQPRLPSRRAENKPSASAVTAGAQSPRRISLMELDWQDCRWIVEGTGERAQFCGLPRLLGCSYCPAHFARSVASAPFILEAAE